MRFDYPGYDLHFIQCQPCRDESAHLFTLIFKFNSPVTKYHYIVRAEYHEEDFFALKFYCKKDRRSDYKYSKIVNKGDVFNILITCLKAVPFILQDYPTASFGFVGARSIDKASKRFEPYSNTQRYKVYSQLVKTKVGQVTFKHIKYDDISGYLLINRNAANFTDKEALVKYMIAQTYVDILNI